MLLQCLAHLGVEHTANGHLEEDRFLLQAIGLSLPNDAGFRPGDCYRVVPGVLMTMFKQKGNVAAKAVIQPDQAVFRLIAFTF